MSGLGPHLQQAVCTQDKFADRDQRAVELVGALQVVRRGIARTHAPLQIRRGNGMDTAGFNMEEYQ